MHAVTVLKSASRSRWLARRRKGITATDAPALLGLTAQWRTPLAVWLEKVRPDEDRTPTYPMRRGRAMESVLADEWARSTGAEVVRPPLLLAHPEHPLLLASVDRFAHYPDGVVAVLELKTASDWREWADGVIPDAYAVQVLWQLMVTGLDEGVIFADVAGRLETRSIQRDREWEAQVIPRMLAWWDDRVIAQTPPPLDPYRDYVLLNRVWEPVPGETVEATDAVMGAVQAYAGLTERAKTLDRLCTQLKTDIRAHMGTASVLTSPEGLKVASLTKSGALRVTYKPTTEGEA